MWCVGLQPASSSVGLPDRQESHPAEQMGEAGNTQASAGATAEAKTQPQDTQQTGDPRYSLE